MDISAGAAEGAGPTVCGQARVHEEGGSDHLGTGRRRPS